jgi:hypothetical protein
MSNRPSAAELDALEALGAYVLGIPEALPVHRCLLCDAPILPLAKLCACGARHQHAI